MAEARTGARSSDRDRDALRAAHLYYLQDLTMDAIARELRTSRSSVSRLLSHARESGLVEIRLRPLEDTAASVARDVRSRFGLAAHVVPVPDTLSVVERRDRVALSAARILNTFIDSNQIVGIAWGSTMSAVSRSLIPKPTHDTVMVQLNGSGNIGGAGTGYASELLRRFGDAYGARVEQFPVPAFFDDPRTRDAFWRERAVLRILDLQRRLDVALFGVGSPFAEVPSHVYHGDYLDRSDYDELQADGAVGDVATVFYRTDGSADLPLNARATGPDFTVLRRTPRRVCVASGPAKVPSLRGAIAAGLITDLVIDEPTALALLAT